MSDYSMTWCEECRRWVPQNKLVYFDGHRVCQWCLDGVPTPESMVYDPHHEEVQCIYCDSYNTTEQAPQWRTFKCNDCGELFTI